VGDLRPPLAALGDAQAVGGVPVVRAPGRRFAGVHPHPQRARRLHPGGSAARHAHDRKRLAGDPSLAARTHRGGASRIAPCRSAPRSVPSTTTT
jgi:hypothetical protein